MSETRCKHCAEPIFDNGTVYVHRRQTFNEAKNTKYVVESQWCDDSSRIHMAEAQPIPSGGERQCPSCGSDKHGVRLNIRSDYPAGFASIHPYPCDAVWHDQPTPAAQPVSAEATTLDLVREYFALLSSLHTQTCKCRECLNKGDRLYELRTKLEATVIAKHFCTDCGEMLSGTAAHILCKPPVAPPEAHQIQLTDSDHNAEDCPFCAESRLKVAPPEAEKFVRLWSAAQRYFAAESDPDGPAIREELRQVLKDTEPSDEMCITADRVEAENRENAKMNDAELLAITAIVKAESAEWEILASRYGEPQFDPHTPARIALYAELQRRNLLNGGDKEA